MLSFFHLKNDFNVTMKKIIKKAFIPCRTKQTFEVSNATETSINSGVSLQKYGLNLGLSFNKKRTFTSKATFEISAVGTDYFMITIDIEGIERIFIFTGTYAIYLNNNINELYKCTYVCGNREDGLYINANILFYNKKGDSIGKEEYFDPNYMSFQYN